MNKSELIEAIADEAGISKTDAKRALEAILKNIGEALKQGERISILGFGSFSISRRVARTGRNPQTGKTIHIKAKKVIKFKASDGLINKGTGDGGPRNK